EPCDGRLRAPHDAERAIELNGVLPRLHERTDGRGVDELGRREVDDQVIAVSQGLVERLPKLVSQVEVVFPAEHDQRSMRPGRANLDSRIMERGVVHEIRSHRSRVYDTTTHFTRQ